MHHYTFAVMRGYKKIAFYKYVVRYWLAAVGAVYAVEFFYIAKVAYIVAGNPCAVHLVCGE